MRSLLVALTVVLTLLCSPTLLASGGGGGGGGGGGPYLELDPPFVVNLLDGKKMRFMQIKVQVMAHDPAVLGAFQTHKAPIRHAMIMLLTQQSIDTMRTVQGREQVRAQTLETLRQVLYDMASINHGLEAVYFTDFVIQ